jgi:hypothetical protein
VNATIIIKRLLTAYYRKLGRPELHHQYRKLIITLEEQTGHVTSPRSDKTLAKLLLVLAIMILAALNDQFNLLDKLLPFITSKLLP